MKKTKSQRKREKIIKRKRRIRELESSERKFAIESVNGTEIAYTNRETKDIVTEESIQHIENLSKIAIEQLSIKGRGAFLLLYQTNPNNLVYLKSDEIFKSIKKIIPEAFNYVCKIIHEYDPYKEFIVINIFNYNRIAIAKDALRISDEIQNMDYSEPSSAVDR